MTSERDELREAITARGTAKEAVGVAEKSAQRSKQILLDAQAKLAKFGDVNGEILNHRAASFKNVAKGCGPQPSLALPPELLAKERARDEAAAALAADPQPTSKPGAGRATNLSSVIADKTQDRSLQIGDAQLA